MVDIHAHPGGSLAIGRRGENEARRVVFDLSAWRRHYGEGTVQLLHQRAGDESPYPCALTVEGDTAYWLIQAADVAKAGWGSAQLHYYVGDTLAKSAIWRTVTADALGDPSEPPEDPARAWFAAIREQIGNLDELTTKAKDNLVAAINEAARSGGGGGSVSMRVDNGYIQYSADGGASWENLIATADLQGPKGADGTDGITPHIGDNGNWYLSDTDTGKPSRGATGAQGSQGETGPRGPAGPAGADGKDGAGMDITGATVGQIAKIAAVDASGVPTAWEPVDMLSGGGETWEKIAEIDFDVDAANDVSVWEYKNLPNFKELAYRKVGLVGSTETESGLSISVNDSSPQFPGIKYAKKGGQSNGWGEILLLPFGWSHINSGSANLPTNYTFTAMQTIYNAIPFDGESITSLRLSAHPTYKIAGGKLSLYGRR